MLPTEVRDARVAVYAAHAAYLAALRAYTGAVGRQDEATVQRALLRVCERAADTYDASLLHLTELLTTLPPSRDHLATLSQLRALQCNLAHGRRLLRTASK
jgi:hypothetical protein